ncbi:hypothetical protein [Chlorobium sp. KB01]|uniref:hypothetical protein n=1 Tax=Chlorobium sp. KB01 TaxID=1917528 RepID=UPI0009777586|nr:hypothetical protein [Chlorobium sp. KB01]
MKKTSGLSLLFRISVLLGLFLNISGVVLANNIIAAYNIAQQGVTIRTLNLVQVGVIPTLHPVNGVAAGPDNNVYMVNKNHIYNYSITTGSQLKDMQFPDDRINYTDIAVRGNRVYASYNGSQLGFTVRDLGLNQLAFYQTGFSINGIAAGLNNDLYLASGNRLYRYSTNGVLLKVMTFPDPGIIYTDVAVICGRLLATYSGSQKGFTIRDLVTLNQYSFVQTPFDIGGIVGGSNNDVYISGANKLYNYTLTGQPIQSFTWTPQPTLEYGDMTR